MSTIQPGKPCRAPNTALTRPNSPAPWPVSKAAILPILALSPLFRHFPLTLTSRVLVTSPLGHGGGKTPSEYIFSVLPQIADIVRSAFDHLANPRVLRITAVLAPSHSG